jgi:hypothetical protein
MTRRKSSRTSRLPSRSAEKEAELAELRAELLRRWERARAQAIAREAELRRQRCPDCPLSTPEP